MYNEFIYSDFSFHSAIGSLIGQYSNAFLTDITVDDINHFYESHIACNDPLFKYKMTTSLLNKKSKIRYSEAESKIILLYSRFNKNGI